MNNYSVVVVVKQYRGYIKFITIMFSLVFHAGYEGSDIAEKIYNHR